MLDYTLNKLLCFKNLFVQVIIKHKGGMEPGCTRTMEKDEFPKLIRAAAEQMVISFIDPQ